MAEGWDADDYRDSRDAQQKRRADRLPHRVELIMKLAEQGYLVEKKSEYQFRINGLLDLYPIHHRYHLIKENKRGGYKHAYLCVENFLCCRIRVNSQSTSL